jgi:hypothetical protein
LQDIVNLALWNFDHSYYWLKFKLSLQDLRHSNMGESFKGILLLRTYLWYHALPLDDPLFRYVNEVVSFIVRQRLKRGDY